MQPIWKTVLGPVRLVTTFHILSLHFILCRRVVHRNSPRHTLHTHKTSTRIRYSQPRLPASCSAWPAPLWAIALNPVGFFSCPASGSESEATPEKRPRTDEKEGGGEEARGTPKQKNRRRCYRCQTKLELVQQELGSCRCGQYQHSSVAFSHMLSLKAASTLVPLLFISLTWFPGCGWKCVSCCSVSVWPEKLKVHKPLLESRYVSPAFILTFS